MLASLACLRANAQTRLERRSPTEVPAVAGLPTDAEVGKAVVHELGTDRHLVSSGIEVTVRAGIVQLGGTVATWPDRERAGRVAAVVSGVRAVVNHARVIPVRRPDAVVVEDVRARLRSTAALARVPITVRVADGIVELTGAISSWDEQQLAERVASAVPGVRFCQNQLTSRGSRKRTRAVIAGDVQSRLDWDPLLQHASIRVSVAGARVSLAGTVGGPLERREAVAVSRVRGVGAVDARALIVDTAHRPDPNLRSSFPSDGEIAATIRDLAAYWPAVTGNVSTSVVAGVVTLNGMVPSLADSRALEASARSAVGVRDVRNQLRGPWLKQLAPAVQRAGARRR